MALALTLVATSGQGEPDSLEDRHERALAANPTDVSVELRVRGGRTRFFQGELIPLELSFSSSSPQRYRLDAATYDRSGRLSLERFHVDPAKGAVDPLRDYFALSGMHTLGGIRTMPLLDREPEVIELTLNEWLRFDRPGDYRLYVTSGRLEDLSAEAGSEAATPTVATSAVELFILPAQPDWSARKLEQARADLDSKDLDRRRRGCSALRHLGSAESIAELMRRSMKELEDLGDCRDEAALGLFAHPDRAAVIEAMEAHFAAPDGVVDTAFIQRLARLTWLTEPPPPAGEEERTKRHLTAVWRGIRDREAAYTTRLAGLLDEKRGPALASGLAALLESAQWLDDAAPAIDLDALRPQLARHFTELSAEKQSSLLAHSWQLLRDPSFRPVLLRLYEQPPELPWYGGEDLRDLAIRRLLELDPDAAHEIVLAEMARPEPRLDSEVFELLPGATLPPPVEAAVVRNLRRLKPSLDGLTELSSILARFGSPAVRGEVEAVYDSEDYSELQICWRSPFLAYFLRLDPEAGAEKLRAALARPRRERDPECAAKMLGEVAAYGMSPALEGVAIEALDAGDPKLERAAIEVLGAAGSAAAEAPLWQRFERWHQEWKNRPEDLRYDRAAGRRPNQDAADLEWALVAALSKGAGWVAGRAAVERLGRLCLSDQTKREVEALAGWMGDEVILTASSLEPPSFDVAQYRAESLEALKSRLDLYPDGTVFRWRLAGRQADPAAAEALFVELEAWLAERGKGLAR